MIAQTMPSVYFIGIAGSGMLPLALFASKQGWRVAGSDPALNHKKNIMQHLTAQGIRHYATPQAQRLTEYDNVVYSSAIKNTHIERKHAAQLMAQGQLKLWHRMDFLNHCLRACKQQIAVAGTHGKTSTTAMLGWLLRQCGLAMQMIAGGRPLYLEQASDYTPAKNALALYESDESDASFLQSQADIRLLLNIDSDHLEQYKNITKLRQAFAQFAQAARLCVLNSSDEHIAQMLIENSTLTGNAIFYHIAPTLPSAKQNPHQYMEKYIAQYLQKNKHNTMAPYINFWACFWPPEAYDALQVYTYSPTSPQKKLHELGSLHLQVPGQHFASNAFGALALCIAAQERGLLQIPQHITPTQMLIALGSYSGCERRIEKIGVYNGSDIYDDYAHHPTAIRAVLAALRGRMAATARLHALFQPHRYSRTAALHLEFAHALSKADVLYLLPIYSAGEKARPSVSRDLIAQHISHNSACELHFAAADTLALQAALQNCATGDVLVALGAGSISQLIRKTLASMNKSI